MPFARKLFAVFFATTPLTAHVACPVGNGDALPPEVLDAAALEASNSGRRDRDEEADEQDAGRRDGSTDAREDARPDAQVEWAVVLVNEIYVDIDGLGDGAEFVELRGEPGTPVDDLTLRILEETGAVKYTVSVGDLGQTFGGDGLWVVGGNQTFKLGVADRVDRVVPLAAWGLQTSRGAVQLVRGTQIVDVVGWSTDPDAGPIPPPPTSPFTTGKGSPAAVPTIRKTAGMPAHSFGRQQGTSDTNDNRSDFCSMAASPGYEQKDCD